ncbi:MAG: hypothetical protein QOI03_1076 [Solirubrobacteraceae bacterium]|jgi:hypothetical protein|nr:hypothetical protein [Solirubrobacteraceae bacterium]
MNKLRDSLGGRHWPSRSTPGAGLAEAPPAAEQLIAEETAQLPAALTLSTMCVCGHERRDHCGLRMDARGRCLECDCEEFTAQESPEQIVENIHAALDQVRSLRTIVARLQIQLPDRPNHSRREH